MVSAALVGQERNREGGSMSSQVEPDEHRLWRRVRRGDRGAAEELARATYGLIYRSLFKLCGGDEPTTDSDSITSASVGTSASSAIQRKTPA